MRAFLLLATGVAAAMGLRQDFQGAAWSTSGESLLVRWRVSGPEGGGELKWIVAGASGISMFTLSSNLSDGAHKRERVDAAACRSAAANLEAALRRDPFSAVQVTPARCAGNRDQVVRVTGPSPTAESEDRWTRGGVTVEIKNGAVAVVDRAGKRLTQPLR